MIKATFICNIQNDNGEVIEKDFNFDDFKCDSQEDLEEYCRQNGYEINEPCGYWGDDVGILTEIITEETTELIDLLNTDIKHCHFDTAEKVCEILGQEPWEYIHDNEDLLEEFRNMELDCKPDELTEAWFLWYNYWNEFVDYLQNKYNPY